MQVTRGFYREDRDVSAADDRAMVASAADMRREEARSRRAGRDEDVAAEREELARLRAKEAKVARARARVKARRRRAGGGGGGGAARRGGAAFLDDAADDDEDEDGEDGLSLSE